MEKLKNSAVVTGRDRKLSKSPSPSKHLKMVDEDPKSTLTALPTGFKEALASKIEHSLDEKIQLT